MTDSASPPLEQTRHDAPDERASSREALEANWLLTHSGITVRRFIGMHVMGAIFPLTAGLLLYLSLIHI